LRLELTTTLLVLLEVEIDMAVTLILGSAQVVSVVEITSLWAVVPLWVCIDGIKSL